MGLCSQLRWTLVLLLTSPDSMFVLCKRDARVLQSGHRLVTFLLLPSAV